MAEQEKYADAVEKLHLTEVLPACKTCLCAAIYTQLSDIENEANSLMSYDRKVTKLDEKQMNAIVEKFI